MQVLVGTHSLVKVLRMSFTLNMVGGTVTPQTLGIHQRKKSILTKERVPKKV